MQPIPMIELNEPRALQRGRIYGEAVRDMIREVKEIYTELFGSRTGQTWHRIASLIGPYCDCAKQYAPHLLEEIEGIAQGARCTFEDIFILNARSEIMYRKEVLDEGCSALVALPEATRNGETLIAQNWDWYKGLKPYQVILKIAGRDKVPPLVTFTEAGQLAKIGMNGAGLGLVVNNLIDDQSRVGVPWILLSRMILESTHLSQAMGNMLSPPRGHSINFLIAHAGGEAVNLETSPAENHILWPRDGIFTHTNHYLQACKNFNDMRSIVDPRPSSYIRWRRVQHLLERNQGRIDMESVQATLKDHFDKPFSVCMHENTDNANVDPPLRLVTCLSIAMNLKERLIHYSHGNPCENETRVIQLEA